MVGVAPLRVALLRGINLGRDRRVSMGQLREVAAGLGWTGAATYLQSGNLLFRSAVGDQDAAAQLSAVLAEGLGIAVDVIVRGEEQLRALLDGNPFGEGDPARVVIACCDRQVPDAALARMQALATGTERVALADTGRDLYASFPDGQARSRLAAGLIDSLRPATGTARNLRTMVALADLLRADGAG